ncbi:MAG: hypothetical protein GY861_04315 [bacterium]|nr:hypothetical protein [bacterium]
MPLITLNAKKPQLEPKTEILRNATKFGKTQAYERTRKGVLDTQKQTSDKKDVATANR